MSLAFFYMALLIAFCVFMSSVHWLIKLYFFAINAVTLVAYFIDKGRAQRDERRIPEIVLHAMCLLGGVTGAELGRTLARHKTRKLSFRVVIFLGMMEMMTICAFSSGHVTPASGNSTAQASPASAAAVNAVSGSKTNSAVKHRRSVHHGSQSGA